MDTIKDLVSSFKNATVELLNCLESEQYEGLDKLFAERQRVIDTLKNSSSLYKASEVAEEIKKADIMEMDEKINKLIKEKMLKAKQNIDDIDRGNTARKSYGRRFPEQSVFINKKIY